MGIQKFKSFYNSLYENKIKIDKFKGKIVIIDTNHYIYSHVIGRLSRGFFTKTNKRDNVDHLCVIIELVNNLLRHKIIPFFVFEGKSPKEKRSTLEKRNAKKSKAYMSVQSYDTETIEDLKILKNKYDDYIEIKKTTPLNNDQKIFVTEWENYIKNLKSSYKITSSDILDIKNYLNYQGIKYFDGSIEEADLLCAKFSTFHENIAGVITDDSDILVCGGSILSNFKFCADGGECIKITNEQILTFLTNKANKILTDNNLKTIDRVTHENFVDFSILMGSDYKGEDKFECKIPNVSIEKLFETFVLCDFSIEKLLSTITLYKDKELYNKFVKSWKDIKNIYLRSFTIDCENFDKMISNKYDINKLKYFLKDYFGLDNKYISAHLFDDSDKFSSFRSCKRFCRL